MYITLKGCWYDIIFLNVHAMYSDFHVIFTYKILHGNMPRLLMLFKKKAGNFCLHHCVQKSHESSVRIALGYRLDNQGSRVRFPLEAGNFSLHHHIQNGCGAHPASYPMGTMGSFPGGKAAGA
jgi:hypothetical protein